MIQIEFSYKGKDYEIAPMDAKYCEEGAIILEKVYKKWSSFSECEIITKEEFEEDSENHFVSYKPIDYFFWSWFEEEKEKAIKIAKDYIDKGK